MNKKTFLLKKNIPKEYGIMITIIIDNNNIIVESNGIDTVFNIKDKKTLLSILKKICTEKVIKDIDNFINEFII